MPPLAYTALTAAIVLSALGAVVICGLTALYGFTPDGEESPGRAARRTLFTRVGHAVAAGCFAATAILLAVVISQPARPAPTPAGEVRMPVIDSKLDAQMQRLHGVEQRMKDSEQTLERLEMEVSEVTARRMGAEPEPPARVEEQPAPPAAKPATRPRSTAAPSKPAPTTKPVAAKPAPPAAERIVVTPPPERVAPPPPVTAPPERAFAPKPSDDPAASPASPLAPTPPAVSASPKPPPAHTPAPRSSETAPANDLRGKFRNDWHAIQRGWDRAADDLKRAIGPLRGND